MIGHDLLAVDEAKELESELEASTVLDEVLAGADVVVALNSEQVYADIDWSDLNAADRPLYVIDTRCILDTQALESNGITFDILGSTGR